MDVIKFILSLLFIIGSITLLIISLHMDNKWWKKNIIKDDKSIHNLKRIYTIIGICGLIFGIFIMLWSFENVRKLSKAKLDKFLKMILK
jgi:uncharacterized membrane protein YuzA (DUF378 family)